MGEDAALPLILITVGAILMPGFARKLSIPVAIVEILYGLILGESVFGIIGNTHGTFISFLSEVGFAFFLFLAGLEINFERLEKQGIHALILPVVIATSAFGFTIGVSIWQEWGIWVGLATGATSVPLLLAIVTELRLGNTNLGKTMITLAAVGETLTILFLSVVEIHHHSENTTEIIQGFARLFGLVLAMLVVVYLLRTLLWWYPNYFKQLIAHDDPSEVGVRVGFGLMFAFIGLSNLAHVEPFLGAFIAGALLSFVIRDKGALEHKLSSMAYGFFVPVFFIHVGISLEITLELFAEHALWLISLVGLMFFAKMIPGLLLLFQRMRMSEVVATSSLLAAPLTLVIAIMDLGVRAGSVDNSTNAVVITAGILASLLFPIVAKTLLQGKNSA